MAKGKQQLLEVLSPLLEKMQLPDESYGHIIRYYSFKCKCSSKVNFINYYELCKLSNEPSYNITIIQNGKIFEDAPNTNFFHGCLFTIKACYRINPFENAIIIVRNLCKTGSYKVFSYTPRAFDKSIVLPNICCFKYLFEYFNVYKEDGTLAETLNDLEEAKEVIAISKKSLTYKCYNVTYPISIILRWYAGYF